MIFIFIIFEIETIQPRRTRCSGFPLGTPVSTDTILVVRTVRQINLEKE